MSGVGPFKFLILTVFLGATVLAHAGEPVCAKTSITLRKGPSPKQAVSWKAARYMPFMRMQKKSGWSKVEDLEGEEHWAKSTDLTSAFRCVVVKTNVATLRREPAANSPPMDLKTADRYTPFKKIGNERDWVQVEDETGRRGWVHESTVWKPVNVQSFSF